MASITYEKASGRRTIQFVGSDGRRRSIRLGPVSRRQAEAVKVKVEDLSAARATNHVAREDTLRWFTGLDDATYAKFVAVGLAEARQHTTLGAFLDDYIQRRSDVKESTRIVYGHTRRNLVEFFGANRPLRSINPGEADHWKLYLSSDQKLRPNTVRRRCGIAKQFLRAALRLQLLPANPFADIKGGVLSVPERFFFVTREMARQVLDACPDAQWRLLFALSRYGGLRCPSEHLRIRWVDVNWDKARFLVHSPKTEHHQGKDSRWVPIFPELLPYLREAFEEAPPGTEYVITRYRDTNANLRTQLCRIIRKAGLKRWPKLFQNLRSTRETELAERWPLHVVCAWIGNSQPVAARHYLQVTDEHFARATQESAAAVAAPAGEAA